MPFQVSPGVNVSEIDLTTVIPAVSTSVGAFAGRFRWGPVETSTLISTEDELAEQFGKPTTTDAEIPPSELMELIPQTLGLSHVSSQQSPPSYENLGVLKYKSHRPFATGGI